MVVLKSSLGRGKAQKLLLGPMDVRSAQVIVRDRLQILATESHRCHSIGHAVRYIHWELYRTQLRPPLCGGGAQGVKKFFSDRGRPDRHRQGVTTPHQVDDPLLGFPNGGDLPLLVGCSLIFAGDCLGNCLKGFGGLIQGGGFGIRVGASMSRAGGSGKLHRLAPAGMPIKFLHWSVQGFSAQGLAGR